MRREFEPPSEGVRLVMVAESPQPQSSTSYNPNGEVSEPLFSALMKQLRIGRPKTEIRRSREFQKQGWVLVDATYKPVNKLSKW